MLLQFPISPLFTCGCIFAGAGAGAWIGKKFPQPLPFEADRARLYYGIIFVAATLGTFSVSPITTLLYGESFGAKSVIFGMLFGWWTAEIVKYLWGVKAPTGDPLALSLSLGLAISRIGCLFGHCCYGVPYTGPLALEDHGALYFPAPLLESFFHLGAFVVLLRWSQERNFIGKRLRLYLAAYCVFRFFTEYLRPFPKDLLGMSLFQVAALLLLASIGLRLLFDRGHATGDTKAVGERA